MRRHATLASVILVSGSALFYSALKRDQAHAFYEGLGFARHGYSFLVEFAEAPA